MLNTEHVKNLIKEHQKKAADHVERLKAKTEQKEIGFSGWIHDEEIARYWSHSDVLYLSLNSCDFVDYYSKNVYATGFIMDLEKIKMTDSHKLEKLYFEHVSTCWRRQGITRSKIPKASASKDFLDRVFNL